MKKENWMELVKKAGPLKLSLFVICGVLLFVFSVGGEKKKTEEIETGQTKEQTVTLQQYRQQMQQELVTLLKQVDGVGEVEVMLTLKASNEKVTLKDNTDKGDTTKEETVLIEDENRNSSPYVVQEKEPELEGVVVVCEGGENTTVKREITDAVCALFQIESHKIKVMKSKEAKE